jgi:hypothetical protein
MEEVVNSNLTRSTKTKPNKTLTYENVCCQYRLKIPHSAGRKGCHPPEKMVESFSRLVENETGW